MKRQIIFLLTLCLSFSATLALSQTSLGEIGGFVVDNDGKAIVGATISVTSEALIADRNLVTGSKGYYRIINLPPGRYTLTISKEGYQAQEINSISVRAGSTSSLNITMTVGDFEETINIVHDAPIIDLKSPERSFNIDGEFIKRMPITYDREWDAAWALVPGTINEGQYGEFGNRVTVHNGSVFQNVWNLEGINVGSTFTNANNIYFSPDIIDEVHIVTNGYDASVASAQGGYINVVTKSGGNDFSGSAALYYQPTAWNWSNLEGGQAPERSLLQPSFTFGGPILKDKAWFFTNYRYQSRDEAYGRSAEQLAYFDMFDLPRPTQDRETRGHQFFGKVTYQLNDDWKLVGLVNSDESYEDNADIPLQGTDNTGIKIERGGQFYSAKLEGALGDKFSITGSASYFTNNNLIFGDGGFNTPSYTRFEETISFFGLIFGSGRAAFYGNRAGFDFGDGFVFEGEAYGNDIEDERFEYRADARYFIEDLFGNHEISFGFDATPYQKAYSDNVYATPVTVSETKNAAGQWVPFYQRVLKDTRFTNWDFRIDNYAGYIQDSWVVNDRLSISAGLRIEQQKDGVVVDITEYSPNFGFNYALTSNYTDSIRASYGIRHNLLAGREGASSSGSGSSAQIEYWDSDLDGTWDIIEESGTSRKSTEPDPFTYFDGSPISYADDLGMPYAHEFQAGYARLLPYNLKLDLAFIYTISKARQDFYDDNPIYQGNQFVGLRDESVNHIYIVKNEEQSSLHYQSYEVSLTKEFSDGWQLLGSYTYQSSLLKGEWELDNPLRYLHPASWFGSPDDGIRPHVLRLATHTVLPWDLTFSANVTFQSGHTDVAKILQRGDGVGVPRFFELSNGGVITHPFWTVNPLYQARNKDRDVTLESLWIFNIGFGKNFEIAGHNFETQLQAFNLFNNDSYAQKFGGFLVDQSGTPIFPADFGSLQPPRAIQWLVKYTF